MMRNTAMGFLLLTTATTARATLIAAVAASASMLCLMACNSLAERLPQWTAPWLGVGTGGTAFVIVGAMAMIRWGDAPSKNAIRRVLRKLRIPVS